MLIDVIPFLRLPRSLGAFTYRVPEHLVQNVVPGAWVTVPFRGKNADAIVLQERTASAVQRILPVQDVLPVPPLTREQMALGTFMHEQYFVSLSHAFLAMLPERPKRVPAQTDTAVPPPRQPLTITPAQRLRIAEFLKQLSVSRNPIFFPLASRAERIAFFLQFFRLVPTGQHCVVVPTLFDLHFYASYLAHHFDARLIVLDTSLAPAAYWEQWHRVRERSDSIVLTTKKGLFAPFRDLRTVIMEAETDASHKQADQNPRYHVRTVIRAMVRLYRAREMYIDAIPSLTLATWKDVQKIRAPVHPKSREVIDMMQERTRKNFAPLADSVQEALGRRGPHLLFLNRRGFANALYCVDCGWTSVCPRCNFPFRQHDASVLLCHRCLTTASVPTGCPRCRSVRFRTSGMGTQQLETWLRVHSSGHTIQRIDQDQRASFVPDTDVTVATEKILQTLQLPRFRSITIVGLEQLAQFPDFRSQERAFALVERVFALGILGARLLIQSYAPRHPLTVALRDCNDQVFVDAELAVRRALRLPPVVRVVKLVVKAHSSAAVQHEALKGMERLRQELDANSPIVLEGPHTPLPERERTWFRRFVLMRNLPEVDASGTLQRVLDILPDRWLVDVDPESLST